MKSIGEMDQITFKVNGVEHTVGRDVNSEMTLVQFLREKLELRGTKNMCLEGSCGICCVSVIKYPGGPVESVSGCMVSIMSCHDWEITTIEGIGNRQKGYHVIQTTLAEHNGTQCGFCSPAWVTNMYSLLQSGRPLTMLEIEKSFGSNICRCTGYRSILEAFKTFGSDAPAEIRQIMDIEDLQICKKTGRSCDKKNCDDDDWCIISSADVKKNIKIQLTADKFWYKAIDLPTVFDIWRTHGTDSYMLVAGNTARGVNPIDEFPNIVVDITGIPELKGYVMDQNCNIGAGNTLTELIEFCRTLATQEFFGYLEKIAEHIDLVASIPIRNLGTIGGNLMIKHRNHSTPSDIFLLLEAVGAYVTIVTAPGETSTFSMQDFLREDMEGKIILNVILPPLTDQYKLVSYKMMARSQSVHPIINGGFLIRLGTNNNVLSARIVYGGLSPTFVRAEATERYLAGKLLFSNSTLQGALAELENELVVLDSPPAFTVEYRTQLALSLFYKACLSLCPSGILNPRYVSGATNIHDTRPVSRSQQTFDTDRSLWPLNEPIPKIEALIQCAGEAKYTDDIPTQPGEVHAAYVLATVPNGDIVQIDASAALRHPGVLAFFSAADIPGENTYIPAGTPFFEANEEVFASTRVSYMHQAIGIIVAETHNIAVQAAKMVTTTYTNVRETVFDIKAAKEIASRNRLYLAKPATERGTDVVRTIRGQNTIYGQMHIPTETISCVTRTTEEGLECFATTQWMDGCQYTLAKMLNMDASKIDVSCRRVGGGLGMKISRANQSAGACGLVTHIMNRPCRLKIPLSTSSKMIGKRDPCHTDFEVDVSATGVIQSIRYRQYEDNGYMYDERLTMLGADVFNNCYTDTKWDYEVYDTITDNAKTTWCRSPVTLNCISLAECVIERIAYELSLDPCEVRKANLDTTKYSSLLKMAEQLNESASYKERRANVDKFNNENRWKKRGLRCAWLRWTPLGSPAFDVNLSVCHADGSVIITHGGIEMGQGINTKAVQVCAHLLKIPVDKIQIKGNNTTIAPNCFVTGGSLGSQNVVIGVSRCCAQLLERLEPVRTELGNPTWLELIHRAFDTDVDLQSHGYSGAGDALSYDVFGVALAEAEVDVLTGESEILRVDIIQDVGQSVSPLIDIGQIEGAFIMGQGYWTSEEVVYDKTTGEVLTDRLWSYWVPGCRDIPQDFRVTFNSNSYSTALIFGAKGTGEPTICMSVVCTFAIREAMAACRKDAGVPTTTWFDVVGPYTVEKIRQGSLIRKEDFLYT